MSKKNTKKPKAEQMKIPGTGRQDACEVVEKRAESMREAQSTAADARADVTTAQKKLTQALKDNKLTEYFYIDGDGIKRRAYIKQDAEAKVQKVKADKAAPNADAE